MSAFILLWDVQYVITDHGSRAELCEVKSTNPSYVNRGAFYAVFLTCIHIDFKVNTSVYLCN
jgi:hypothetical protein